MPSCAVKWCINRSHLHKKNAGISDHLFPQDTNLKEQWTRSVRLERQENDWSPSKKTIICSVHFQDDDFYMTKKGYKKLKTNAIPICTMVLCSSTLKTLNDKEGQHNNVLTVTPLEKLHTNKENVTEKPNPQEPDFGDESSFKSETLRVYQKRGATAAKFDDFDFEGSLGSDSNEESISENDTIHVFCPKCNTKVPHTAAGIQQDQTKMLIAKVYHYFEQEYEELKRMYGNLDLSPLAKFRQRTALATGVSDSMLQQILEEERLREEEERTRAQKRRRQEDSLSDDTSDDSDGDAEAHNDVQPPTPAQPFAANETLVVKIEQPENINIDEPEIFVPASLKTEPRDYDDNNEQVTTDPISLEIKTEPQEHEIPIVSQELTKPGTSKHKERKRTRTSQNTSTQQPTQGKSSTASTSRNILMEALEQSSLLDDTEFKTEEIDVHEEGFS